MTFEGKHMNAALTKCKQEMETKLKKIAILSRENRRMKFDWLIQHFSKENLTICFHELDGKKAKGEDGVSKEEYGENLDKNVENLIERMKSLNYYPAPVREVKIPKDNGKYRPLGISNIEDKIIQMMYAKILSAIYEPIFSEQSYGFRPRRGCIDAVRDMFQYLSRKNYGAIIDVDLSNFFGTINHRKLILLLEMKIKDRTFIRYIVRMLKSGILSNGELKISDIGTPQGSIVSPVLANIFAHYAMDTWIENELKNEIDGDIHFVRYADDFIIYSYKRNAENIMQKLKKRLDRFSLVMNEEKSRISDFSKGYAAKDHRQETFNFLGFTFYIGKSRKGKMLVKIKTDRKRFTDKIKQMTTWCKFNRNKYRLKQLWKMFLAKIRGHVQYYGVSHNYENLENFVYLSERIFFKWINRRSQKKSFNWEKFNLFKEQNPLPIPKIVHRLF